MSFPALTVVLALGLTASPALSQDFWKHWGDGRAELNGYRLTQPRYGAARAGTGVYVFVTEDFSDSLRVKADPGKHAPADVHPVMKLNAIREFQTGIYDYNVMTSVFLRIAPGWPLAKVSFSSQEWCGHVWHQLIARGSALSGLFHSYFDAEADGTDSLDLPSGGILEDALPIVVRGWNGELLKPGESRSLPLLPSLLRARLEHRRLAWAQAKIKRSAAPTNVKVPAGTFSAWLYEVDTGDGRRLGFAVEAAAPFRLVRQTGAAGEELQLLGSTRLPYWQLNQPGAEKHLRELGLPLPAAR